MKKLLSLVATGLFAIAAFTVTPASWVILIHQPKAPKCLLK